MQRFSSPLIPMEALNDELGGVNDRQWWRKAADGGTRQADSSRCWMLFVAAGQSLGSSMNGQSTSRRHGSGRAVKPSRAIHVVSPLFQGPLRGAEHPRPVARLLIWCLTSLLVVGQALRPILSPTSPLPPRAQGEAHWPIHVGTPFESRSPTPSGQATGVHGNIHGPLMRLALCCRRTGAGRHCRWWTQKTRATFPRCSNLDAVFACLLYKLLLFLPPIRIAQLHKCRPQRDSV